VRLRQTSARQALWPPSRRARANYGPVGAAADRVPRPHHRRCLDLIESNTRSSPDPCIGCLQPSCKRRDRSTSPHTASMWSKVAVTAGSRGAPIAPAKRGLGTTARLLRPSGVPRPRLRYATIRAAAARRCFARMQSPVIGNPSWRPNQTPSAGPTIAPPVSSNQPPLALAWRCGSARRCVRVIAFADASAGVSRNRVSS